MVQPSAQRYATENEPKSHIGRTWLSLGSILFVNSASADGGPRSPSAHAWRSAQPTIGTSGIFPAHVSAESPSNISPNPAEVISEVSELYNKPSCTIEAVVLISTLNILCKNVQKPKLTETNFFQLVWPKDIYKKHSKKELGVQKLARVLNFTPEVAQS